MYTYYIRIIKVLTSAVLLVSKTAQVKDFPMSKIELDYS
jgi:hypothetical protein